MSHPVEQLSAFLDHELPEAERRGVEAHLDACPSCARHLRELAALDALAREAPPAEAPDGYHDALPGRVRRRIRADRPASRRAPWVWPLAAGLALAVLAPLVLRQQLSRARVPSEPPAVSMDAPAAPATTMAPEQGKAAAPLGKAQVPQDERRRMDSGVSEREGALARPPAASGAPPREAAPEPKAGFAAAPSTARANEQDRAAPRVETAVAGAVVAAPPAAPAAPTGQETLGAAGRRKDEPTASADDRFGEGVDAASPSKKTDAARPRAAEPKAEDAAFRDTASLPADTPEQARKAREAWGRFVSLHPTGPRADEGRVRFIEAAVAVFRLTRDAGDRAIAEREGRAYLADPGAAQAPRVRAALRRLDAAG